MSKLLVKVNRKSLRVFFILPTQKSISTESFSISRYPVTFLLFGGRFVCNRVCEKTALIVTHHNHTRMGPTDIRHPTSPRLPTTTGSKRVRSVILEQKGLLDDKWVKYINITVDVPKRKKEKKVWVSETSVVFLLNPLTFVWVTILEIC